MHSHFENQGVTCSLSGIFMNMLLAYSLLYMTNL